MRKNYKTIQVDATIHEPFKEYCRHRDISLGKVLEGMMQCAISGSLSGSGVAELLFGSEYDALYRNEEV